MRFSRRSVSLACLVLAAALGLVFGSVFVTDRAGAAEKASGHGTATKATSAASPVFQQVREEPAGGAVADQLSKAFRAVAKAVKPAVVEVRVKKRVAIPPMPGLPDDFMRRFFGEDFPTPPGRGPERQKERFFMQQGLGSGFVVDSTNGYVLTNHHVVGGADEVEVVLGDGRKLDAEWVRSDWQTDVAVLKIKADRLTAVPLGDSSAVEIGDWVLAVGAPEGLPQTVTAGIISAKGRTTGGRPYEDFLQTDASINHGNSGGPLVNMRGEVIGINTAIVSRTGVNEGIGLAIPSSMAKSVMVQLLEKGKVTRGYLGVGIQDVDAELAKSFKLPDTKGALVTKVMKDSPAEKAGIKEEDFVVALDGQALNGKDDLRNRVAELPAGRKAEMTLIRKGEKMKVSVTISAQPAGLFPTEESSVGAVHPQKFGLEISPLTKDKLKQLGYDEDTEGVLITDVQPGSDASEKGLRQGMVVDRVNGKKVTSPQEFADAVAEAGKGGSLRLRVLSPDGSRRYVVITAK